VVLYEIYSVKSRVMLPLTVYVLGVSTLPVSVIILFAFGTVKRVCYFLFFNFLLVFTSVWVHSECHCCL